MNKTMNILACLAVIGTLVAMPAGAQEEQAGPTTREQVETELSELKEQLGLPEYTWTQVHLILKTSIRERLAISKKFHLDEISDIEELSSKQQRSMRKELKRSRKSTAERMERYLDKEQMKNFEALQEDIDTEFLARLGASAG